MKCPNCSVSLVMTDRQGIEIDYCPQCRGVWLDRGELDKVIERANAQLVGGRRRDDDDDRKWSSTYTVPTKKKKLKSVLGDLFEIV
jgi:Zn-finger nucleic acid-binding protein